jgi:hypothetical protein
MRSHAPQVAARGESSPLLRGRNLYTIFTIVCVVKTTNRLPVLFDEPGVLGVDHHCIRRRMAEKCLDDVHGRVVIQMFGRKIVREKHERRAVGALSSGSDRKFANTIADRLDASSAGMPDALEKIRRRRAGTLLVQIPMIADRNAVLL